MRELSLGLIFGVRTYTKIKDNLRELKKIILADPDLKLKFKLLIQVPGIGEGTATAVL